MTDTLEQLLDEARESSPSTRLPEYRDRIAGFGAAAVEPLTAWIGEPYVAAFAVRTLERVAILAPSTKSAVVEALYSVDRASVPEPIRRDLDDAARRLGVDPTRPRRSGGGGSSIPVGMPGRPGRRYWAMRTSPWERPYVWAEAQAGRLRQGWGWAAEQDLERIADLVRHGAELSEEQLMSWPSRRMLSTEADGMRTGDLILAPNLPEWGRLSVFELTGSYRYEPDQPRGILERFGHILPVELVAGDVDRHGSAVSEGLRATTRNPSRLWNIDAYGGDVESIVDPSWRPPDQGGRPWTEAEYGALFDALPPDGPRPDAADLARLASDLGRTSGAVEWQWNDGAAYVTGRSASTTSEVLKHWLDRTRSLSRETTGAD